MKDSLLNEARTDLAREVEEKGMIDGFLSWMEKETLKKVVEDPVAMAYAPFLTKTVCIEAVKRKPDLLEKVPAEHRDAEICMAAVMRDGMTLKDVPETIKTKEICLAAARNNHESIDYAPREMRKNLYMDFVKETGEIQEVPGLYFTPEMAEVAAQDGFMLQYVPEKFRTKEICEGAVETYGKALEDVPEKLKTEEICVKAIQNDPKAIEFVPEEMREAVEKAAREAGKPAGPGM